MRSTTTIVGFSGSFQRGSPSFNTCRFTSSADPFDRWPTGKGFDYFYGFQGGETNQYYSQLYQNTLPVEPAKTPEQGYTFNEDLADHAIAWLDQETSVAPGKPWFMYYATGAMHAPHHVPQSYIDRFKGQFDMGWDKYRDAVYANQLKLGVIPASTKLTTRPSELPAWDSLSADQKRLIPADGSLRRVYGTDR